MSSKPILESPRAGPPLLKVEGLHVFYGEVQALHGVDFDVRKGEFVALLGANGAGKTTTLRTVVGLLKPRQGRIELDGTAIAGERPDRLVRRGMALVPEGRRVFPHSSAEENLELGAITRTDPTEVKESLARVYGLFPVLKERRRQIAGSLSGGEQQMLAIGRALMSRPRLLLLDEPSMGLAPRIIEQIFELIEELNRSGVTILVVEQNANLSLDVVKRAYVLEQGRTVLSGSAAELAGNREVAQAYLGL